MYHTSDIRTTSMGVLDILLNLLPLLLVEVDIVKNRTILNKGEKKDRTTPIVLYDINVNAISSY